METLIEMSDLSGGVNAVKRVKKDFYCKKQDDFLFEGNLYKDKDLQNNEMIFMESTH